MQYRSTDFNLVNYWTKFMQVLANFSQHELYEKIATAKVSWTFHKIF